MVYICADDYGFSEKACERIDDCIINGALNKISVFPNSEVKNLNSLVAENLKRNVTVCCHLNLVEGKSIINSKELSLLVGQNGHFKNSFLKLLFMALFYNRKKLKSQLYKEIKAQLLKFKTLVPSDYILSIDSHQHTHMIPLIFKTVMQVIRDENISVKYIRIPSEPISPYLLSPSLYFTYNPANIIKQWLLKFLNLFCKKEIKKSGISTSLFMGILFSGSMDKKRVSKVFKHYLSLAEKKGSDIELLFHPAYLKKGEPLFDETKKSFKKFYYSVGRKTEFDTLKTLKF